MTISSLPRPERSIASRLHGVWRLLDYRVEEQGTGRSFPPLGDNPTGYALFTPEGRLSFTLTASDRQPPESLDDQAALLNSVIAYSGTYRLEDDRWITRVDVAWNPEWVGTEQVRQFTLENDQLKVLTPWRVMPNWPERGLTRSIVRFEREP